MPSRVPHPGFVLHLTLGLLFTEAGKLMNAGCLLAISLTPRSLKPASITTMLNAHSSSGGRHPLGQQW